MNYSHFTFIASDSGGSIQRIAGQCRLGKHGIKGAPGATAEYRVTSVEDDPVKGWGDATAIGHVELLIDGRADDPPRLALLA